jgi:hypothetical protein
VALEAFSRSPAIWGVKTLLFCLMRCAMERRSPQKRDSRFPGARPQAAKGFEMISKIAGEPWKLSEKIIEELRAKKVPNLLRVDRFSKSTKINITERSY